MFCCLDSPPKQTVKVKSFASVPHLLVKSGTTFNLKKFYMPSRSIAIVIAMNENLSSNKKHNKNCCVGNDQDDPRVCLQKTNKHFLEMASFPQIMLLQGTQKFKIQSWIFQQISFEELSKLHKCNMQMWQHCRKEIQCI